MSKFSVEDNDALLNLLYYEKHPQKTGPRRESISRAIYAIRRGAELEEENESLRSLVREMVVALRESGRALQDIDETGRDFITERHLHEYVEQGRSALAKVPEELK